jgi:hypothetical protein
MREEQQRELQVLSDADASAQLRKQYSFKDDPELAATARRLAMAPIPHMINIEMSASPTPDGPVVYLIGLNESGKKRLRVLRAKLAAEQR